MAKQEDYDIYHDYDNRGWYRYTDPTLAVVILIGIVVVSFLKGYWSVVLPCFVLSVVAPITTYFITRNRHYGKVAAILGIISATIYFCIWFFVTHPGFLEVVLGLKPY